MVQYSVSLALFDYIPTILFATGLMFSVKVIEGIDANLGRIGKIAVMLVVLGGLLKATWKLLIATADINFMPLNNALFICMAPGFTFLTYSIWAARRRYANNPDKSTAWRCPASAVALFAALALGTAIQMPDKKIWFFILLLQMTVANVLFTWHAVRYSLTIGAKTAALLFALNLIGVFVMSGLARVGDNSEAFQWIAQLTNTFTQGSMALAGWLMWKQYSGVGAAAGASVGAAAGASAGASAAASAEASDGPSQTLTASTAESNGE